MRRASSGNEVRLTLLSQNMYTPGKALAHFHADLTLCNVFCTPTISYISISPWLVETCFLRAVVVGAMLTIGALIFDASDQITCISKLAVYFLPARSNLTNPQARKIQLMRNRLRSDARIFTSEMTRVHWLKPSIYMSEYWIQISRRETNNYIVQL